MVASFVVLFIVPANVPSVLRRSQELRITTQQGRFQMLRGRLRSAELGTTITEDELFTSVKHTKQDDI